MNTPVSRLDTGIWCPQALAVVTYKEIKHLHQCRPAWILQEKVVAIRHAAGGSPAETYIEPTAASLFEFEQCAPYTIEKVIQSAAAKFCSLDSIPTMILKEFLPELLLFVLWMNNASLEDGNLPLSQRHTIVIPWLKKLGLDRSVVENYRPISNLSFMLKVVERLVCHQLVRFLENHNILPTCQLPYGRSHLTETAVLKIVSDALLLLLLLFGNLYSTIFFYLFIIGFHIQPTYANTLAGSRVWYLGLFSGF